MRIFRATLNTFSFWGSVALLICIFVFNVPFLGICSSAIYDQGSIKIVSIFLLGSFLISIILNFLGIRENIRWGLSIFEYLVINWNLFFTQPFYGIGFISFINKKRKHVYTEKEIFLKDLPIFIMRFFNTIIWWILLVTGILYIRDVPENIYLTAFSSFSQKVFLIRILWIFIGYVLSLIIIKVLFKLTGKKYKQNYTRKKNSGNGTKREQYYMKKPWHMPEGCFECGGNYPECKDSCPLFDD